MYDIAMTMRFSPHLEYDDEQGAFHTDMLRDDGGCWISAADFDALKAERDRLAAALRDAATSLHTIAIAAGRVNGAMAEMGDVRGYAHSRWTVAYAAQTHVA